MAVGSASRAFIANGSVPVSCDLVESIGSQTGMLPQGRHDDRETDVIIGVAEMAGYLMLGYITTGRHDRGDGAEVISPEFRRGLNGHDHRSMLRKLDTNGNVRKFQVVASPSAYTTYYLLPTHGDLEQLLGWLRSRK